MTTITLDPKVKDELGHLKPNALTWDEYLLLLLRSVDLQRYEAALKASLEAEYAAAIARARDRFGQARDRPETLVDPAEARKHVRALRRRA